MLISSFKLSSFFDGILTMKIITLLLHTAVPILFLTACSTQPKIQPEETEAHFATSLIEKPLTEADVNADVDESQIDDVWLRIPTLYQLDIDQKNPRIDSQLRWFATHQSYLDRISERGKRYLYHIVEQVEERNIPAEIALLPIVESAFEPFAYSHGLASGVWQFIPSTGRSFGLHEDWWYDGRRDIRAATDAALTFLSALQREFDGDWLLALAAYNSGAGTVRKAIRYNQGLGKPTDFWSLNLPRETRAYVPKLIALAKLVRDAEEHGVVFNKIPNEPYFAVVETFGQIDLAQIAELSNTDINEIYQLNPAYKQWATHPNGPHEVLIPVEKVVDFETGISSLDPSQRVRWQNYVVKNGDTLISIAKKFNTTAGALAQSNNIRGNIIHINDNLLIPSALLPADNYTHSESQRLDRTIAARQPKNTERIDYTVRDGDSFWKIANAHKVTVANLARWNGMVPKDSLLAGQNLIIWSSNTTFQPPRREEIRKINYRVRQGDSFARISQKFNVSLADVMRWNSQRVNQKYLQPGQTLTLYVDVLR